MRSIGLLFLACAAMAQAPTYQPVGSVAQIMLSMSYPFSDELLYIERDPPKTDAAWTKIQYAALIVAESGNLLMMPGRARDQDGWMRDAKLMVDAGVAALKAARARDLQGILALNDQLVTSCTMCHEDYRPNYKRRRQQQQQEPPVGVK
jgi:cytochrome c556